MEEAERPRLRGGGGGGEAGGNGGRGEGFITKDLLLLPGGGEALERATAARGVAYVCGVVRLSDAQTSIYTSYIHTYIYIYV